MTTQEELDYSRIAEAIGFIRASFKAQPTLEEAAERVHLSPAHFQRLFTRWAGTSPKKFLQYISTEHAKAILREGRGTLLDATMETGLSSTSRLHELFVGIEGMTPAEYKHGGKALVINYSFAPSPFGLLLVASSSRGICHMAFAEDRASALGELMASFPNAAFRQEEDAMQQSARQIFNKNPGHPGELRLHLKGTGFQLKVWESLLRIPPGGLTTYGAIAAQIGCGGASRAVGTAIGSNPVAYLIPCHRVIRAGGTLGGYRWGTERKAAIIGWESARAAPEQDLT